MYGTSQSEQIKKELDTPLNHLSDEAHQKSLEAAKKITDLATKILQNNSDSSDSSDSSFILKDPQNEQDIEIHSENTFTEPKYDHSTLEINISTTGEDNTFDLESKFYTKYHFSPEIVIKTTHSSFFKHGLNQVDIDSIEKHEASEEELTNLLNQLHRSLTPAP